MVVAMIICLIVLCLVMFWIEIFVIPGAGFAGVIGTLSLVALNIAVFSFYGVSWGFTILAISLLLFFSGFWWVAHSKTLDRYSLKKTIDSTSASDEQLSVCVGDEGVALTRLALVGNADIDGKEVEVKSSDGMIDEGTAVVVSRVCGASVWVRRK